MTRPTIIAGNWKLNPSREDGEALYREVCEGVLARGPFPSSFQIVVIPPFPYLGLFVCDDAVRSGAVALGAQDIAAESWGAFTGAVGGELLSDFGARYALVGHSERRHHFGESDSETGNKVAASARAGITPVLCVGETESERDSGETFEVVERQLHAGLDELPEGASVVIAYEPVWAIGTGRTASREQAAEVHRFVRHRLAQIRGEERAQGTAILYGGSVKTANAADLLADNDIDGALIGGASLKTDSFLAIVDAGLARIAS